MFCHFRANYTLLKSRSLSNKHTQVSTMIFRDTVPVTQVKKIAQSLLRARKARRQICSSLLGSILTTFSKLATPVWRGTGIKAELEAYGCQNHLGWSGMIWQQSTLTKRTPQLVMDDDKRTRFVCTKIVLLDLHAAACTFCHLFSTLIIRHYLNFWSQISSSRNQ